METAECWQLALHDRKGPSLIALTRQNVAQVRLDHAADNLCTRGAYELAASDGEATVSLFATGSEIEVAMAAKTQLDAGGLAARVVSVPCFERFAAQDAAYRAATVGNAPINVGIEAAVRQGWDAIIGSDGLFVGMHSFGASAPAEDLYKHFGITADAVVETVKNNLGQNASASGQITGTRRRG